MGESEEAFNGLRMSLQDMRREADREAQQEQTVPVELSDVGSLFATFRGRNRNATRTQRSRGNHPSRTFVWLGSHTPSQIYVSNCEAKKIKLPSASTPEEILTFIRRAFPVMGNSSG
jgi:hypothetical protein